MSEETKEKIDTEPTSIEINESKIDFINKTEQKINTSANHIILVDLVKPETKTNQQMLDGKF